MSATRIQKPRKTTLRAKTVTLFGGSGAARKKTLYRFSYDLGKRLAESGYEIVNGGYTGTMEAAARGAADVGGTTIGVTLPSAPWADRSGLQPNPYLTHVRPANDLLQRIDILLRMAGAFIILDGGTGTLTEFALAWEYVGKKMIPVRPIIVTGDKWGPLIDIFTKKETAVLHRCESIDEIIVTLDARAVSGTRARFEKLNSMENRNDRT